MFRDEKGRARIFHGQNVVVKGSPYLPEMDEWDPQMSLTEEDVQQMVEWGVTIVRLGLLWEAVETAPGVYDYDYLASLEQVVNRLGDYGIYVMLDGHQDVFSR